MKSILITGITFFLLLTQVSGQETNGNYRKIETGNWLDLSYTVLDDSGNDIAFMSLDKIPEFHGGFDALAKFITDTLKYPPNAIENNIKGTVYTSFVVDPTGKVKDVQTERGVCWELDSACVHAISIMPDWAPGMSGSKGAVTVRLLLPIRFVLE